MTRGGSGLTDRRKAFINVYIRTWSTTKAAEAVGYKFPRQAGTNLRRDPVIQAEIERRMKEAEMEAAEVIYRLAEQARADISDFIEPDAAGDIQINWKAVKERGYLVKSIRNTRAGPVLELHDSQKALELIGKNLGMFIEKINVKSDQSGEITVRFETTHGRDDQMGAAAPAGRTAEGGGPAELTDGTEPPRPADS